MNMTEALNKAGFENSKTHGLAECEKKYGSLGNFKFPVKNPENFYTNMFCERNTLYSTEGVELFADRILHGLMKAESTTVENLLELFRVSEEDEVLSAVSLLNKGLKKEILHITDDLLTGHLAWFIRYVKAEGKFYLHVSSTGINLLLKNNIEILTNSSDNVTKGNIYDILFFLVKKSAFIPVVMDTAEHPVWVHEANGKFYKHSVESYLGQTILDSEELQAKYAEWFNQGYTVNSKVWYLGLTTKEGFNYLKRDLTRSPKESNNM